MVDCDHYFLGSLYNTEAVDPRYGFFFRENNKKNIFNNDVIFFANTYNHLVANNK